MKSLNLTISLRTPHREQRRFISSQAKRKVIRAGRRGGKTTGAAILAVKAFLAGRRILYAAPTEEQVGKFWRECKRALQEPIHHKVFYKNETKHLIELAGTEQCIRAKTAWNEDTLRGDYADLLILDEYQLMDPDAWELVGAPMLLDNNGDAVFIYTKKRGLKGRHAGELFKKAEESSNGRWAAFNFSSHANPHLSKVALEEITQDMTRLAYREEVLGEEVEDDPDALWKREDILRETKPPEMERLVVAVDPSTTATGDEAGIIVAGRARVEGTTHFFVMDDASLRASPAVWAKAAVTAYHKWRADRVVAEKNNGGEMVELTLTTVEGGGEVPVKLVHASRGKRTRAEPVSALYEQKRGHHVGTFAELEDELCNWVPGAASPNRLDALVWAGTELMLGGGREPKLAWVTVRTGA